MNTTFSVDMTKGENCSNGDFLQTAVIFPLVKHPVYVVVILCLAYGVIFVSALLGNILVIVVVYRNPWMRNVTNYFVVNLAVADIFVAVFCIPWTLLDNIYTGWRFGSAMCKLTPYVQQVCVCASVTTLAVIAIDRYLAICNTWHSRISRFSSRIIILFIWISSLVVAIPKLIFYEKFDKDYGVQIIPLCNELWPHFDLQRSYFVVCLFVICYALPLTIILVCYLSITVRVWTRRAPGIANNSGIVQKSKIKVAKMFAIVVSLFVLSWLPLYALFLKLYFSPPEVDSEEFTIIFSILVPLFQWLGLSNSSINPLVYYKFSVKYRHGFKNLIKCQTHNTLHRTMTRPSVNETNLMNTDSLSSNSCSRRQTRLYNYSTVRFMSVMYANDHIKVTFRKEDD